MSILGLHHITLVCSAVQRTVDFERRFSVCAFVKKTVNFDDPGSVGANDLPMMEVAGLSVAYHAKSKVRERAMVSIDEGGLDRPLALFDES